MVTKLFSAQERITCSKSRGGMGFRDLKAFNSAMLAKQWWNIMSNPDSLCLISIIIIVTHDVIFGHLVIFMFMVVDGESEMGLR